MKKQIVLEIEAVCMRVVAGNFAMFSEKENRGANFSWKTFPADQEKLIENWLIFFGFEKKLTPELLDHAKIYSKEFAEMLCWRMTK